MYGAPVCERPCGTRWMLPVPVPSSVGNNPARVIWYCARAASMFSTDTRRSRLFFSAISISRCRRGSTKNSRQPMAVAACPLALRAPAAPGCVA
ncbi:hypothetical protein BCO37747_07025 [Burkholderia contaminans]|nr:hypothetical protein BCO37747_07025 [Burkholderia contaminans]